MTARGSRREFLLGLATIGGGVVVARQLLTESAHWAAAGSQSADPQGLDRRIIDVRAYGADPSGQRDSTAAVARAVADLSPGAIMVFAKGTYAVTEVLLSAVEGVRLMADGARLVGLDPERSVIRAVGCQNIVIQGAVLRHAAPVIRNSSGYGIHLEDCSGYEVSGCEVGAVAAAGVFVVGGRQGTVRDNFVHDTFADGIHHTGGSSRVLVADNRTQDTGDDGVAVVSYRSDGEPCQDITVSGNQVLRSHSRGISVVGGRLVTMVGNIVNRTRAAGLYVASEPNWDTAGVRDVRLAGNSVRGANTFASPAYQHGSIVVVGMAPAFDVEGVEVTGNTVNGGGWTMISIGGLAPGTRNVTIHDNTLTGPNSASDGIGASFTSGLTVLGNHITEAAGQAIRIDGSCSGMTRIAGNVAARCGLRGLD